MKKFLIIGCLSLILQSCFYIRKARKVEVYELDKRTEQSITTFIFEYPGDKKDFEKNTKDFFKTDTPYFLNNFTTNQLFSEEDLNVFIYTSQDKDVMVNLLGFLIRESLKRDNDNDRLNDKDENPNPDTTFYYYVHVQITDKNGKDVLSESSMKREAVINKLIKYKNYLN